MTERLTVDVLADDLQDNVPPSYAVYMFDPKAQTFLIVAAPPAGKMNVHPAAILARTEPTSTALTPGDATLAAQNLGLLDVRSIYDTDELGRMGDSRDRGRRPGRRLHHGDRQDGAGRSGRHPFAGRRPREDEGSGAERLQLRARHASSAPCAPSRRCRA